MKKIDCILKNAILLTLNEELEVFNPGSIAIHKDSIVDIGPDKKIIEWGWDQPDTAPGKY